MDIVVIGAGPGGLMASGVAASRGANVTLLEKNEKIGKKLFITGKGRCNVTNDILPNEFLDKVVVNNKFLYSSIFKFTPQDCMQFFENHHTPLKVERGGRVFPVSDKSSDIIKALNTFIQTNNVNLVLNTKVNKITKDQDKFIVYTDNKNYACDKVIIATGGKSYTATGSTGDGYIFAKNFGHKISNILPALVPIDLKGFNSNLAGISLKNVKACITCAGSTYSEFGELLFTHTGVSGPVVLTLSSRVNKLDLNGAQFVIDLKPALDTAQLDARLLRDFESCKNKDFVNYMPNLLPKGLIEEFVSRLDFGANKKIHDLTKQNRQQIINTLKNFTFDIKALKPVEYGIVTSGGVDVKQINANTMESKLIPNLYFVGEVLDVDAVTGGYNIQIALSTGYLAGISSTKE